MTFEIAGPLVLLFLIPFVAVLIALVLMPHWLSRSISRCRLRRLRTDIKRDIRVGVLPADHPAVQELLHLATWRIENRRALALIHHIVWARAAMALPAKSRDDLSRRPSLQGLSEVAESRMGEYREIYSLAVATGVLLGSWIGITVVLPALVVAFVREERKRASNPVVVITKTRVGQRSIEQITCVDELHEHAPLRPTHAVAA